MIIILLAAEYTKCPPPHSIVILLANGFRNTYIYANYSNYINVTAISPWGFRDSYLYAQYAESVNIYATGNGMFHIFEDLSGVYLL